MTSQELIALYKNTNSLIVNKKLTFVIAKETVLCNDVIDSPDFGGYQIRTRTDENSYIGIVLRSKRDPYYDVLTYNPERRCFIRVNDTHLTSVIEEWVTNNEDLHSNSFEALYSSNDASRIDIMDRDFFNSIPRDAYTQKYFGPSQAEISRGISEDTKYPIDWNDYQFEIFMIKFDPVSICTFIGINSMIVDPDNYVIACPNIDYTYSVSRDGAEKVMTIRFVRNPSFTSSGSWNTEGTKYTFTKDIEGIYGWREIKYGFIY